MDDKELIEKFLSQYSYDRKVISNSGTPQISFNQQVSKEFVGFNIGDHVVTDLRYSSKHHTFYWAVYPEGEQPNPDEVRDKILEALNK